MPFIPRPKEREKEKEGGTEGGEKYGVVVAVLGQDGSESEARAAMYWAIIPTATAQQEMKFMSWSWFQKKRQPQISRSSFPMVACSHVQEGGHLNNLFI